MAPKQTHKLGSKLEVTFMTGIGTVTGANFLLTIHGPEKPFKLLIDCGMVQGSQDAEAMNRIPFTYNPAEIDMLIVTHAHLDHVGRIAKLVKDGFKGVIYSTPATRDLAELIMADAVNLLKHAADRDKIDPLYASKDVDDALNLWKTCDYHTDLPITAGVTAYFKDAGHILGSAIVEITADESVGGIDEGRKKIVFTGDLGNSPTPILRDTDKVTDADYLIMESVYGDRNHEPQEVRVKELTRIINETHARGGTLVIPAFSLERTQIILYEINNLLEEGKIPSMPVFLDSPLATKVTQVYRSYAHLFNYETQQRLKSDDIFDFPKLTITETARDSQEIVRTHGAKIIIAGSGMSMGGRVRRHEAEYAPSAQNTILLVGYQPVGTLGRLLQDKASTIDVDGKKVKVKARIEMIFGYSAHKDSDHLVEFVSHTQKRLRKVFVVMGEPSAATHLAQRLGDELKVKAICPEPDTPYAL